MIDHITIPVKNIDISKVFYTETLAIIGYEILAEFNVPDAKVLGYGKDGKPSFWIGEPLGTLPENGQPFETGFIRGLHFAFLASSEEQVEQWFNKCLELGGKDNGKPGPRPEYHEGYYGAFIIDPDGWKIEACIHERSNS